jgi:hypothetical protein
MKMLVALVALVSLAYGHKLRLTDEQCGPDETLCPGGCCPEANWYCCADATYCAATEADCPMKTTQLAKLAKRTKQCGPDETPCPSGCCPGGPNWFCCPDNGIIGCADIPANCPGAK